MLLYQWVAQESMNIDVTQLEIFYILFNNFFLLGHKLIICSMDFARSERGEKKQHVCKSKHIILNQMNNIINNYKVKNIINNYKVKKKVCIFRQRKDKTGKKSDKQMIKLLWPYCSFCCWINFVDVVANTQICITINLFHSENRWTCIYIWRKLTNISTDLLQLIKLWWIEITCIL